MATIKSHTDLEQAKILVGILPEETADMWYHGHCSPLESERLYDEDPCFFHSKWPNWDKPCWSLTALLNVLPNGTDIVKEKADTENERYMCTVLIKDSLITTFASNPVDACVEAIIKWNK